MPNTPLNSNHDPAARHLAAGLKLLELRRFEDAVKELRQYLQSRPEDPAGHYHLSRAYYGLSKLDEAIECAKQSLSIDPTKAQPMNIIGLALYKKGEWQEAEKQLRRAVEIEPNNTEYWLSLAVPYLYKGEWAKVAPCVEEVLKINPQHPVAFNYKAQLAMQKGDFEKAREYIAVALGKEPERSMHHAVAGQIEGMSGNTGNAKQHFETAISKDPAQVGHRMRYLNTRFSGSFVGQIYRPSSVWGIQTFNFFYRLLLLNLPLYWLFYLAMESENGIAILQVFYAPLLLLFAVYAAIPTLYKMYLNKKYWGGEGVDMTRDYANCAMLTIGLIISATGLFIVNKDVILLGILWLLFAGGINWSRQVKERFVVVTLIILIVAIIFTMLAVVLQLLGAKLGYPDVLKFAQYGLIAGASILAINLKEAFSKKKNETK